MNLCEVWVLLNTGIVCIGRRMVEVTDSQIFITPQVGVSVAVDLIITAPCHRMNCSDSGGDVHGTITEFQTPPHVPIFKSLNFLDMVLMQSCIM